MAARTSSLPDFCAPPKNVLREPLAVFGEPIQIEDAQHPQTTSVVWVFG
jgi:hypothetical protein